MDDRCVGRIDVVELCEDKHSHCRDSGDLCMYFCVRVCACACVCVCVRTELDVGRFSLCFQKKLDSSVWLYV